jgi:micrococcal nuclease
MTARWLVPLVVFLTLPAAVRGAGVGGRAIVVSVHDGDTVTLAGGARVRLLQIDTPELGSGECYSRAARTALIQLVPLGSAVTLQADPALDRVDRYGRLLRYVWRAGTNVNLRLVREGAAAPYFYRGDRGRYADALMAAARGAKSARRGLWKACPGTVLDPYEPVQTGQSGPLAKPRPGACDRSYPTVCIPPPPPDLDCADVPYRRFAVRPPDPHHFDGDHDGIGCES